LNNEEPEDGYESFDYKNFENIGTLWKNYEGEFIDGTMDGFGTLTLENGEKLVGNFKEGKVNG
jgi:hypothetical protein